MVVTEEEIKVVEEVEADPEVEETGARLVPVANVPVGVGLSKEDIPIDPVLRA